MYLLEYINCWIRNLAQTQDVFNGLSSSTFAWSDTPRRVCHVSAPCHKYGIGRTLLDAPSDLKKMSWLPTKKSGARCSIEHWSVAVCVPPAQESLVPVFHCLLRMCQPRVEACRKAHGVLYTSGHPLAQIFICNKTI